MKADLCVVSAEKVGLWRKSEHDGKGRTIRLKFPSPRPWGSSISVAGDIGGHLHGPPVAEPGSGCPGWRLAARRAMERSDSGKAVSAMIDLKQTHLAALDRSAVHWSSQDRGVTLMSTAAGLVSPSAAAGPKRKHCRRAVELGRGTPMDGFWKSSRIGRLLEQRKVPWKGNPRQVADSKPPPTLPPLQAARAVCGPTPAVGAAASVPSTMVGPCRSAVRSKLASKVKPCRFRLRGSWCGGIRRMLRVMAEVAV